MSIKRAAKYLGATVITLGGPPIYSSAYILMQHRPHVEGGTIPIMVYLDAEIAAADLAILNAEKADSHSIVVSPLNKGLY